MEGAQKKSRLWLVGIVVAIAVAVLLLGKVYLSLSHQASSAMQEGRQVIINVATGEITLATPQADSTPAAEEETSTKDDTPLPPISPEEFIGPMPQQQAAPAEQPALAPAITEPVIYDGKARLSVIITGLGMNRETTEMANLLPAGVTMSYQPYAANLQSWVDGSRRGGHEVLLDLPMQTSDYPLFDPGPLAILADATKAKNIFNLKSTLTAAKGYVGLFAGVDENLTRSLTTVLPIIDEMKKNNVLFIYNEHPGNVALKQEASAIGLLTISHYIVVDEVLSTEAIDTKLAEVQKMMLEEDKTVLVIGRPYPLTLRRIEKWLGDMKARGVEPSPVTSIINS